MVALLRTDQPCPLESAACTSGRVAWFSIFRTPRAVRALSASTVPSAAMRVRRRPRASGSSAPATLLASGAARARTQPWRSGPPDSMRARTTGPRRSRVSSSWTAALFSRSPGRRTQRRAAAASRAASAGHSGARRSFGVKPRKPTSSGPQPVADADDGFDAVGLGAELPAQPADVGVDGAAVDVLGVAPDVGQELAAGLHPAGALHEQAQEAELGRGERDLLAADAQLVAGDVELDAPHREVGLAVRRGGLRLLPPQDRLHPQDHLARAERLADVVVGPQLQADDAVDLLAAGGQHDDGHPGGRAVPLQQTGELQAVHPRQHEVEQDEVRRLAADRLQAAVPPAGGLDGETLLLQVVLQDLGDVGLIFDEQDAFVGHRKGSVARGLPQILWKTLRRTPSGGPRNGAFHALNKSLCKRV